MSQPWIPSQPTSSGVEPPLWAPLSDATPTQAVRRFFTKYATFHGRASRSEYWWWALANVVAWVVLVVLVGVLGVLGGSGSSSPSPAGLVMSIVLVLWFLATIVPNIAITVRRLHDANLSGLLVLLNLVPYLGGLLVIVLTILPSNPMGHRFDRPSAV